MKKTISWLLIIIGSVAAVIGIFSYSVKGGDISTPYFAYYYSPISIFAIALGVGLLLWGILAHREKRK